MHKEAWIHKCTYSTSSTSSSPPPAVIVRKHCHCRRRGGSSNRHSKASLSLVHTTTALDDRANAIRIDAVAVDGQGIYPARRAPGAKNARACVTPHCPRHAIRVIVPAPHRRPNSQTPPPNALHVHSAFSRRSACVQMAGMHNPRCPRREPLRRRWGACSLSVASRT